MSWDSPHAWRDSYDEWKLRSPDWYDDEEPSEEEAEHPFVHQPRMTRKSEAENRALASRAARHAVELGRARYHLSWVARSRDPGHHKDFARDHLERARKVRSTVGPVIDEILVEVPF